MFQIVKCDGANCCSPMKNPNGKLPWLLNPVLCADKTHFTPFDEVVGKETTKKDLPSANIPSRAEVAEALQVKNLLVKYYKPFF